MITVRVTEDLQHVVDDLGKVGKRHIPRSIVIALTKTAMEAKKSLTDALPKAFDRPTRWTMNSLWVKPATKQDPSAQVYVKDDMVKGGTPAIKYMRPEIFGGQRNVKRFERALQERGILPRWMVTVPGEAAPLDRFGNVPASFIVRLMSQIGGLEARSGYTGNETAKGRAKRLNKNKRKGDWLVLQERRGKMPPGIYQRFHTGFGNTLKPVFIFTAKKPNYQKRYDFFGITENVIRKQFAYQFEEALKGAIEKYGD